MTGKINKQGGMGHMDIQKELDNLIVKVDNLLIEVEQTRDGMIRINERLICIKEYCEVVEK